LQERRVFSRFRQKRLKRLGSLGKKARRPSVRRVTRKGKPREGKMRKIGTHMRGHFVAYLALFFALGGTSFAAVNALPKNSVGSP
jgi:hypothetical protein